MMIIMLVAALVPLSVLTRQGEGQDHMHHHLHDIM